MDWSQLQKQLSTMLISADRARTPQPTIPIPAVSVVPPPPPITPPNHILDTNFEFTEPLALPAPVLELVGDDEGFMTQAPLDSGFPLDRGFDGLDTFQNEGFIKLEETSPFLL